jgi:hypothetical protein
MKWSYPAHHPAASAARFRFLGVGHAGPTVNPSRLFRPDGRDETKPPWNETIFRFSRRHGETGHGY